MRDPSYSPWAILASANIAENSQDVAIGVFIGDQLQMHDFVALAIIAAALAIAKFKKA
jgi:hypothetical protein